MSVTLTPQAERRIRELVERGDYPDAAAVIDQALEALETQEHLQFEHLRELVHEGFASGNRVELTEDLWDEMERRVESRIEQGEPAAENAGR